MATFLLPMAAEALGANSFWMGVAGLVGGIIDQNIFGQKVSATQEVGKVSDLQMQTASLGAPIVKGYGTARITGNVIWGTKFTEHIKETSQSMGGGKGGGGGGTITTKTYSYTVSLAVAICEGPIIGIKSSWADGVEFKTSSIDYTLYTGTESQTPDPFMEGIEGTGNVPAYRGIAYIVIKNLDIGTFGNRIPSLSFEIEFTENTVQKIVTDISAGTGIDVSLIDASNLAGLKVDGFTVFGDKTFRSQIEALQAVFIFDGYEYNGKVLFIQRNFSEVVGIAEADLGAYENEVPESAISIIREQEMSLPKTIKLSYISKSRAYQDGVVSYTKLLSHGANEVSISTNVVMDDAQATELIETRMKEAWVNRTSFELTLSNRYMDIQPGKIIELPINGRSVLAIVTRSNYGMPGLNKISAQMITPAAYSVIKRDPDSEGVPVPDIEASEVQLEALDLPLLPVSTENTILVVATGKFYYGANLYRSDDDGVSFSVIKANITRGIMGNTLTKLGNGLIYSWDYKNSVDVKIITGALESRPKIDVLNGYNLCAIGNELMQFTTATLIGEATYRLSGLLRGRFGTEHQTGTHGTSERFALIASSIVETLEVPTTDWFKSVIYRYGPASKPVTDSSYKQERFTATGVSRLPFSPCHIHGKRATNGDITITWIRRTRGDGALKDYIDVPLNELTEKYHLCIIKNGTEIRQMQIVQPKEVYTAAQQIQDFGSVQEQVKVRVYQLSDTRGRGIAKEEII